jgi:hypothetical protein
MQLPPHACGGSRFRANGTVVQDSNDNVSWTTISSAGASSTEWQQLAINDALPYRYIRTGLRRQLLAKTFIPRGFHMPPSLL